MNRTFEDIVNTPELTDGLEVKARISTFSDPKFFTGKIVGKSVSGLIPCYIVECMDGTYPNETYNYKFLSLPISEIFVK